MKDNIKQLIEQRTTRAIKNQVAMKLNRVAHVLGAPVVANSMFRNYLPDVWAMPGESMIYDPSSIQEADDWVETEHGYVFDGLKFGINLNIFCMSYEGKTIEIKTTYNGYLVYAEIAGDLKAYAPFPAWEDAVNMFYDGALDVEKKRQGKEKEEKLAERKKRFANFWQSFKMLWGY